VTVLAGRPLGGQLQQLSTPTHSPEGACIASTPAMEIVVFPPSSTPRTASASKYVPVSLERDKTRLANSHSFDVPKTLAECNRQLFTVKQGIGGLVAVSSPAISNNKHSMLHYFWNFSFKTYFETGTAPSMQSTPIHCSSISSPSYSGYSFPIGLSPFASYTTPVPGNIFDDSLLKESPDLEMLSEVALQTSPSAAHRSLVPYPQIVTTVSVGKIALHI